MRSAAWLGVGLSLVVLDACSRVEPAGEGGGAALMRNLLRARSLEIVAEPGPIQEACREAAERITRRRGVECRVLGPDESGDPRAPRILVGGAWLRPTSDLAASLGVEVDARDGRTSFTYRRRAYTRRHDALVAVWEDPERPGLPLTLLLANHPLALTRLAARIEPGWKPWIRFYRAGELSLEGPLSVDGRILENLLVDLDAARAGALAAYVAQSDREGLWIAAAPELDTPRREAYLAAVARARAETFRWAGSAETPRVLRMILHARPENLAACVPGAQLSSWNHAKNEVHALVAPSIPDDGGSAAARALAEELLGHPAQAWLADGAAVYASGIWWGQDLWRWTAGLRLGGIAVAIASLVDPLAEEVNSSHAILPLRAALFRFLLESRGEGQVRGLWQGTIELTVDAELERTFQSWLDDLAAQQRPTIEARRNGRAAALLSGPFLSAVAIEEPSRSPQRGFGSERFLQSLRDVRGIGARGVVLTCFVAAERDPTAVPDPIDGHGPLEPFETDLRIFAGLLQARASGMKTILQPHLLTAPAGTIAGTGPQGDENGWRRFFDGYGRYAVHVALLAELAEADGLVLGGGMTESTTREVGRGGSDDLVVGWKRQGWSEVIRLARGAFSGMLTWAAASTFEVQGLLFWGDLDALGCDLLPELDERALTMVPKPGPELERRITLQLAELHELARRHGKPLLLTRAGFRSGWPRPGEEPDPRDAADPGLQSFQVDVLGSVLRVAKTEHGLAGVAFARWSSDPADPGVNGRDGLLRPGPARDAVARAIADL